MLENILTVLLTAPAGSGEGGQNPLVSLLPLVLIVVVFYFFMIRPQVKKQKELKRYRSNLSKGDNIVTTGGIYGKVTEVTEQTVMVNIGNNMEIKIDKNAILKDPNDLSQQK